MPGINDEKPSDDPRQRSDDGTMKQSDTPEKGLPEKEQRSGDHKPDLEKWQDSHTH